MTPAQHSIHRPEGIGTAPLITFSLMVTKITENAGVPLYATSFVTADTIVSGGGGGQGAHGIKNKLVVFKLNGGTLTKTSEFLFPENSDSPTSLAANSEGVVWVGANAPPESKDNKHLQRFAVDDEGSLQWRDATNAFKSTDAATYQRSTSVAGTMVAAASSESQGKVVVVSEVSGDATELDFDFEINDVVLSEYDDKERKFVVAVGDSAIEFRNINAPTQSWARVSPQPGHKWTRAAFTAPNTVVVASTVGQRKGVQLTQLTIGESSAQTTATVSKVPRIAGVTAMAANADRLAVAAPSGDIIVYDTSCERLTRTAVLKGVHAFPVTDIAVSSNGTIVSVSLDGSLVLHSGLAKSRVSIMATIWWVVISALFIALVAILTNYQTVLRASRTFGMPGPQEIPGSAVASDYATYTAERTESTPAEPKFLEVPLHASAGTGHGPVVHREPSLSSEDTVSDRAAHNEHSEL